MDVSPFSNLPQPTDALFDQRASEIDQLKALTDKSPEETGKRFEELFTTMLVREFRKTLPEGFFGAGPGADTYESWLDEHLGKVLAEQDTLGLVGLVKANAGAGPADALVPTAGGELLPGDPAESAEEAPADADAPVLPTALRDLLNRDLLNGENDR